MRVKLAQEILRRLHEKQAGIALPLAAGAGIAASAHVAKKAVNKARDYQTGFIPGFNPHGSHE